jgi:hypothetical protein
MDSIPQDQMTVHGFKACKLPEDDKIFQAVLQENLVVIMSPMMKILRAYIAALGCIQLYWRMIRIVFISNLSILCPS